MLDLIRCKKVNNEEFNDRFSSPKFFREIKPLRVIHVGNVARIVERRGPYRVLVCLLEGRSHLGDSGLDGVIILRLDVAQEEAKDSLFYSQFISIIKLYMF